MQIEEITLDEEFELINKGGFISYDFPAVSVTDKIIYFNTKAGRYVPDLILWSTSTNYVIGMPTDKDNRNAYLVKRKKSKKSEGPYCVATFPTALKQEKKLHNGVYKLFKYKDGIAFKRYEQIENAASCN